MLRKIIVSTVLVALTIGGAAMIAMWLIASRPKPLRIEVGNRALLVNTVTLQAKDTVERFSGYGTARADRRAMLSAEVSAPVSELVGDLKVGMAVDDGQLLVRLDDRQYQQELHEAQSMIQVRDAELAQLRVERSNLGSLLEIAEADLMLNRDDLDRVKKLFEAGNASKTEFDTARLKHQGSLRIKQTLANQIALLEPQRLKLAAEKSAALARLEGTELNIERCRITAPFEGRIESISVNIGDKVRIGGEILRLVSLDLIEVPVQMPISTRPRMYVGAEVMLHVESMPDVQWSGIITRIAPVADEQSRTFKAYAEVDNRKQPVSLMPGSFVKADVAGPVIAGALIVPRNAVVEGKIFVVNDNCACVRQVRVDRYLGDQAVLLGDVYSGDCVITTNLDVLYDGAAVRLSNENNDNSPPPAMVRKSPPPTTGADAGSATEGM